MLAYTYPLLSIFWTMLEFFIFFLWIWLVIMVFLDIFRSHDMGGFAKASVGALCRDHSLHRGARLPHCPWREDARTGGTSGATATKGF